MRESPELSSSRMSDGHNPPNMLRRHGSPDMDYSQNVERGGTASRAEVNDHGSKTIAQVALFVAGMCLMGMLWALSVAYEAKRRADIDTMRVEGLTRAMIAHGIKDTYPHLPGEDD